MGFFAGLDQDKYDRQYSDGCLFQRFGSYLKPHRHRITILTSMGLLVSLAMALIPIIIAATVDVLENRVEQHRNTGDVIEV